MSLMRAGAAAWRRRGAAPPSGSRYWRVSIASVETANAASCAELGFRVTPGGESVAVGGVASASSVHSSPYDAGMAFDGNLDSLWSTRTSPVWPVWIRYEFVSPVEIVEVAYTARRDGGTYGQAWKDFSIQRSDDGSVNSWATVWSVTNQTGWASGETRVFTRPLG